MTIWETEILAVNPHTGKLCTFAGPHVRAFTPGLAQQWCDTNGYGYLKVTGDRIIQEVPCIPGTNKPDWSKARNYDAELN